MACECTREHAVMAGDMPRVCSTSGLAATGTDAD